MPRSIERVVSSRLIACLLLPLCLISREARACVFLDEQDNTGGTTPAQQSSASSQPAAPPEVPAEALDFDLLGKAPEGAQVDPAAIRLRRTMLNWHQAVGLGMFAIALANTVVGQLDYSDRFANGPSTGRYRLTHQITAGATLVTFAGTGLLALFAPTPIPKGDGFDRLTVHKIAMSTATAGMATELVLGLYTASREGNLNQPNLAAVHLAIGYLTFAAIAAGVGVLVF